MGAWIVRDLYGDTYGGFANHDDAYLESVAVLGSFITWDENADPTLSVSDDYKGWSGL